MSVNNTNVAPDDNEVMHGMTQSFLPASYFPYSTARSTKHNIFTTSISKELPYLSQNSFLSTENATVRHRVNYGTSSK
jgi:hypothetical protein